MKASSLYVHIPYCVSKCIYCDFFSGGELKAQWDILTDSLLNELKQRRSELAIIPDTLYIGGGTPSLMPKKELERLVDGIYREIGVKTWKEFTIEVNPDDVTEEKCINWKNLGINRVSIGIQSFNDSELRSLKRRHTSEQAFAAVCLLKNYFSNISIDLMFGIPGQTLESWEASIKRAVLLSPEHISAYSLMLEDGTALTHLYNIGKIELPSEEECINMWRMLSETLGKKGYEQYEISNYSLSGFNSIHNSRYWSGNPYLGLGPSAHSYDGYSKRRYNPPLLKGYLDYFSENMENKKGKCFYEEEALNMEELMEEMILTRMRVKEGLNLQKFAGKFGEDKLRHLLENAKSLLSSGYIKIDNNSLSLTQKGIMISNQIILSMSM